MIDFKDRCKCLGPRCGKCGLQVKTTIHASAKPIQTFRCRCEKPEMNIAAGQFDCSGRYRAPCLRCGQYIIGGTIRELEIISTNGDTKEAKKMKLELAIMAGAESKGWLVDLKTQLDRIEGMLGGKTIPEALGDTAEGGDFGDTAEVATDDFGTPAEGAGSPAEDDPFSLPVEEPAKPAPAAGKGVASGKGTGKPGRPKNPTQDDVNDACKAKAAALGKDGVKKVKAALKKNFGSESVTVIDPKQYAAVIALMTK